MAMEFANWVKRWNGKDAAHTEGPSNGKTNGKINGKTNGKTTASNMNQTSGDDITRPFFCYFITNQMADSAFDVPFPTFITLLGI